jgi:hypothetical protein
MQATLDSSHRASNTAFEPSSVSNWGCPFLDFLAELRPELACLPVNIEPMLDTGSNIGSSMIETEATQSPVKPTSDGDAIV